jgi:hypothetical protein
VPNPPDPEDAATVRLTPDEAVVLFELLSRWSDEEGAGHTPGPSCFESTAEAAVLNSLLCELERQLVAPFKAEYPRVLEAARDRLAGSWSRATLRG